MDRLFALLRLKLAIWRHGLRTGAGVADLAAGIGLSILAGLVSLGLTAGVAAAMHLALAAGDAFTLRKGLLVVAWGAAFLAVGVPVFFGIDRVSLPLSRLAVFPLSRGSLYRLSLVSSFASGIHLLWIPSMLAACRRVFQASWPCVIPGYQPLGTSPRFCDNRTLARAG